MLPRDITDWIAASTCDCCALWRIATRTPSRAALLTHSSFRKSQPYSTTPSTSRTRTGKASAASTTAMPRRRELRWDRIIRALGSSSDEIDARLGYRGAAGVDELGPRPAHRQHVGDDPRPEAVPVARDLEQA